MIIKEQYKEYLNKKYLIDFAEVMIMTNKNIFLDALVQAQLNSAALRTKLDY